MNMKKVVVFVLVILFSLSLNFFIYINKMIYCEQKIEEIESNKIMDSSHIFERENLTKAQFLDYLSIFEKYNYVIIYESTDPDIHGHYKNIKNDIYNRINANDDTILYSSYVFSYSLDDELNVKIIGIYEVDPNILEEESRHYKSYKDFDTFLSSKLEELHHEKDFGWDDFVSDTSTSLFWIIMCTILFAFTRGYKAKDDKINYLFTMIYFVFATLFFILLTIVSILSAFVYEI